MNKYKVSYKNDKENAHTGHAVIEADSTLDAARKCIEGLKGLTISELPVSQSSQNYQAIYKIRHKKSGFSATLHVRNLDHEWAD